MLVAPPGHMKTAFLMAVSKSFREAIAISDLNTAQLIKMKESMASGACRTLVLTDMQKISQRNATVADNLFGNLSAVADEGFAGATWDANVLIPSTIVRCTVIGAVTPVFYTQSMEGFMRNGFARRFMWPQVRLADTAILREAVIRQRQLRFSEDQGLPPRPVNGLIEERVTEAEARELYPIVEYQVGNDAIAFQLAFKMFAVLRWWYRVMRVDEDPMDTMYEFGRALGTKQETCPITGLHLPADESESGPVEVILDNMGPPKVISEFSSSAYKSRAYQAQKEKLRQAKEGLRKKAKKA